MPTAKFLFKRTTSISGFSSKNRPCTDAINALNHWAAIVDSRSYEIFTEEDELLIAQLSWREVDKNAGPNLDDQCHVFGVKKHPYQ